MSQKPSLPAFFFNGKGYGFQVSPLLELKGNVSFMIFIFSGFLVFCSRFK